MQLYHARYRVSSATNLTGFQITRMLLTNRGVLFASRRYKGTGHNNQEGELPLAFRDTVLVQSSVGRFLGRVDGRVALVMVDVGNAVAVGKIHGKPVKVIRLLETMVDESNMKSMGMDSRRLTYRQDIAGHEVVALKRFDESAGAFLQDGKI